MGRPGGAVGLRHVRAAQRSCRSPGAWWRDNFARMTSGHGARAAAAGSCASVSARAAIRCQKAGSPPFTPGRAGLPIGKRLPPAGSDPLPSDARSTIGTGRPTRPPVSKVSPADWARLPKGGGLFFFCRSHRRRQGCRSRPGCFCLWLGAVAAGAIAEPANLSCAHHGRHRGDTRPLRRRVIRRRVQRCRLTVQPRACRDWLDEDDLVALARRHAVDTAAVLAQDPHPGEAPRHWPGARNPAGGSVRPAHAGADCRQELGQLDAPAGKGYCLGAGPGKSGTADEQADGSQAQGASRQDPSHQQVMAPSITWTAPVV